MIEPEGYCPFDEDDLINDYIEAGEGDYYQHQHQQQEYPEEFNDSVLTKDNNDYTSDNNDPKNKSLLNTQPLIDNTETTANNNVTLNHGTTHILEDDDNNDNDDNLFSNNNTASYRNSTVEDIDVIRTNKNYERKKNNITTKKSKQQQPRKLFESFDRFTRKYEWRTTGISNDIPQEAPLERMLKKYKKVKVEADYELVQYLTNQWYSDKFYKNDKKSEQNKISTITSTTRYRAQTNRAVQGSDIAITLTNGDRIHVPIRDTTTSKTSTITTNENYFSSSGLQKRYIPITATSSTRNKNKVTTKKNIIACSDLWVDKYSPNNFLHLLSYEKINRDVLRALREWDPYVFKRKAPPPKPSTYHQQQQQTTINNQVKNGKERPEASRRVLLLTGPPGIGKTTLAHIVSRHAGYRPIEINASLDRSKSLVSLLSRSMSSNTLISNKPNSIILDEVDGLDSSTLKPLIKMFTSDIPKIQRPIILIANNKYASVLRPLLPYVTSFHVNAPETNRLVSRCKHILSKEALSMNQTQLLHQLVHSTNNDIRSCLFTLQFISSAARAATTSNTKKIIDLSNHMDNNNDTSNKNKDNTLSMWKDDRMDNMTLLKSIFRKKKIASTKNEMIKFLLDGGVNDINKLLDSVFLNVPFIPFIDPSMDKLHTAYEWLSYGDLYRSSSSSLASSHPSDFILLQKWYIPVILSAVHSLCRTDSTSSSQLTYSTKKLHDLHYTREAHTALLHRFLDGLPAEQQSSSVKSTLLDVIPYLLYFLQAGDGKLNVQRAVSSYGFYTEEEKIAFDIRMKIMKDFYLNFVSRDDEEDDENLGSTIVRLEPEIDQFMRFKDMEYLGGTRDIPSMGKQLLTHTAHLERMKEHQNNLNSKTSATTFATTNTTSKEISQQSTEVDKGNSKMKEFPTNDNNTSAIKSSKSANNKPKVEKSFLSIGAAKSKALLNKRKASSCIGYTKNKKKSLTKLAYSGSGVPLNQVIKFKYQKGFTQAVRIPCRIEDLI